MEWSELISTLGNLFSNELIGNIWLIGIFVLGAIIFFMLKSGIGLEGAVIIIPPLIMLLSFYGYVPASLGWMILIALGILFGLFMMHLFRKG